MSVEGLVLENASKDILGSRFQKMGFEGASNMIKRLSETFQGAQGDLRDFQLVAGLFHEYIRPVIASLQPSETPCKCH